MVVIRLFVTATANVSSLVDFSPTAPNESVPDPSVISALPLEPSAVGKLNAVPPDVTISFEPSDLIDSLVSTNCISLLVPKIILSLKVAAPASDISKVNAVIPDPPSSPLNIISLSCTSLSITKSLEELLNLPTTVSPLIN